MSKTRIATIVVIGVAAAIATAVVVATGHGGTDRSGPVPAASVMRALHEPPSPASAVPAEPAAALATMPGVQVEKARRLISGIGSKGYAVEAAPTADGGVCVASPVGGGCLQSFADDGVSYSVGMNNDGPASPIDRELIAGVASDDVTGIEVATGSRRLHVPLQNGGFVYESPEVGLWADALLVSHSDGSVTRVPVGNANRVEAIP